MWVTNSTGKAKIIKVINWRAKNDEEGSQNVHKNILVVYCCFLATFFDDEACINNQNRHAKDINWERFSSLKLPYFRPANYWQESPWMFLIINKCLTTLPLFRLVNHFVVNDTQHVTYLMMGFLSAGKTDLIKR